MNSYIVVVFYALCQEILEGTSHSLDVEPQSNYRLPGKIILSNIIRQQNRPAYIQKFSSHENMMRDALETNILTQFLNRFQPALDRESKKLVEKPGNSHMTPGDSSDDFQIKSGGYVYPLLWRGTRDESSRKTDHKMTQCTRVPGRVLCKFGPYTYVINTRNRDVDNEELEKIVGMMHQRIQEGDRSFDLSIVAQKDKGNTAESAPEPFILPEEGTASLDSPPVIVECTPIDKPQSRFSGSGTDNVEEIVYSCKWHNLKLKRDTDAAADTIVIATPVSKTCSTALFVRKFCNLERSTQSWCPDTTITPCASSQLPYCVPWCNPFLKDSNNLKQKIKHKRHSDQTPLQN